MSKSHDIIDNWIPENEFIKRFSHIPAHTLNWQLNQRRYNGLDRAVKLIGRQRYISVERYAQWLEVEELL